MQVLAMPIRYLKQVFNGFSNSDKLDFWHLLKLPPLFSTHFLQLVEFYQSEFWILSAWFVHVDVAFGIQNK